MNQLKEQRASASSTIAGMADPVSLSFAKLLCYLRWLAVVGQALTVAIVTGPMRIDLPQMPLWSGIGALAVFNVYATWHLRRAQVGAGTFFLHILGDIAVLAWLVSFSGGIENPFSSLFLLPIAFSILALPPRWVWMTALACALGYGASALFGHELPHVHGVLGDAFGLHKTGMMVNFAVSAIVVLVFFTRMASAWRHSEREVARLREQFTRNEGIVALATHAASVAHELNTPLGTLTLMVEDLLGDAGIAQQREDLATMKTLLDICRDRVRELAAPAEQDLQGEYASCADIERVIERWQLVRPTIELCRSGSIAGLEQVDGAVSHLLLALLNNAADAGEQVSRPRVDLYLQAQEDSLLAEVRDYGVGFDKAQPVLPGTLFRSTKPAGLGIGLALSHATVERLGGELSMRATDDGSGVRVAFRLPAVARA